MKHPVDLISEPFLSWCQREYAVLLRQNFPTYYQNFNLIAFKWQSWTRHVLKTITLNLWWIIIDSDSFEPGRDNTDAIFGSSVFIRIKWPILFYLSRSTQHKMSTLKMKLIKQEKTMRLEKMVNSRKHHLRKTFIMIKSLHQMLVISLTSDITLNNLILVCTVPFISHKVVMSTTSNESIIIFTNCEWMSRI